MMCTACSDGTCVICQADWPELARRLSLYASCDYCGTSFTPRHGKAFCTKACRERAFARRQDHDAANERKRKDRERQRRHRVAVTSSSPLQLAARSDATAPVDVNS